MFSKLKRWVRTMMNRYGAMVQIAWSEKELNYLGAIIDMGAKPEHLREMSELTGRSLEAVRLKCYYLRAKRRQAEQNQEAKRIAEVIRGLPAIPPSALRQLSKDELMRGRA